MNHEATAISSLDELLALYDPPSDRALLKQMDRLDAEAREFVGASPFLVLATCGRAGADCSPRGEEPGFVRAVDDHTLIFPDRRGNNRLDSLRNILENPEVGLLFLVPGANRTLRVNGTAVISRDPELLAAFDRGGQAPRTVVVVTVRESLMQCSGAVARSDLWRGR